MNMVYIQHQHDDSKLYPKLMVIFNYAYTGNITTAQIDIKESPTPGKPYHRSFDNF